MIMQLKIRANKKPRTIKYILLRFESNKYANKNLRVIKLFFA